jgi:hypothetical protein
VNSDQRIEPVAETRSYSSLFTSYPVSSVGHSPRALRFWITHLCESILRILGHCQPITKEISLDPPYGFL